MARHAIEFSKRGFLVTGIDISQTTLEYAKKYAINAKQNNNITFIKADLTDMSNIQKKFDLLFCTETFGHIPSYLSLHTLNEFNKKTKKGGYCLIQFWIEKEQSIKQIIYNFIYQIVWKIKSKFKKSFQVNCSTYTENEIEDMVKRANFKIISKKNSFYLLAPHE